MTTDVRLASPTEIRKLAELYRSAGQIPPTAADMVLTAEREGEACGSLRVVMARKLILLQSFIAQDDEALAALLEQLPRRVGSADCWCAVPDRSQQLFAAAGFMPATPPDALSPAPVGTSWLRLASSDLPLSTLAQHALGKLH
ncbi:hypothetical protein ACTSKR_15900 [Chitinibacteraceae bacterium HSL-7]